MYKLSDSELDIMQVLWRQSEPVAPSALLTLLRPDRDWNISTLNTLITRLGDKGFVTISFRGR